MNVGATTKQQEWAMQGRLWAGPRITTSVVVNIQRWLAKYGLHSTLFIERREDRNLVALRVEMENGIYQAEVSHLHALRNRSRTADFEKVLAIFERAG